MNMNFSPRISFSHDLNQSDLIPIESLQSSLLDYDYDFDFDFCVSKRSCDGESSLADELFANGVILPIEIKSKKKIPKVSNSTPSSPLLLPLQKSSVPNRGETEEEKQGNNNSKSFWKFKRSKSYNCGSLYKRGLLWPLPLLSRSKSTGSTASGDKRSLNSKDEAHHQNHGGLKSYYQKNSSSPQHHQRPPLKKSTYGSSSYNYGAVRFSPVLNVPTEKLLGFASIFSHAKDKGKKK